MIVLTFRKKNKKLHVGKEYFIISRSLPNRTTLLFRAIETSLLHRSSMRCEPFQDHRFCSIHSKSFQELSILLTLPVNRWAVCRFQGRSRGVTRICAVSDTIGVTQIDWGAATLTYLYRFMLWDARTPTKRNLRIFHVYSIFHMLPLPFYSFFLSSTCSNNIRSPGRRDVIHILSLATAAWLQLFFVPISHFQLKFPWVPQPWQLLFYLILWMLTPHWSLLLYPSNCLEVRCIFQVLSCSVLWDVSILSLIEYWKRNRCTISSLNGNKIWWRFESAYLPFYSIGHRNTWRDLLHSHSIVCSLCLPSPSSSPQFPPSLFFSFLPYW